MTKNYIFDFGNVLFKFSPAQMTAAYVKDPDDLKLVASTMFSRFYWDRLDEGNITDEALKADALPRLPERLREAGRMVYDHWYENLEEIEGMRALVTDIKNAGHPIYVLSDISIGFAENYTKVPALKSMFDLFDGVVLSGPLHMCKRGTEIFRYLLNKYGLNGNDCTFIDDYPLNILNCSAVGIHGYRFDGDTEKLRRHIFG